MGGRTIVRTRWGIAIQDRGLASCALCGPGGIVEGADSVGCEGRLRGGSRKGDEVGLSYALAASGHGEVGSHLSSRVVHPKPENPAEESAHPRPRQGHGRAKGSAHPGPRQGRGRQGW